MSNSCTFEEFQRHTLLSNNWNLNEIKINWCQYRSTLCIQSQSHYIWYKFIVGTYELHIGVGKTLKNSSTLCMAFIFSDYNNIRQRQNVSRQPEEIQLWWRTWTKAHCDCLSWFQVCVFFIGKVKPAVKWFKDKQQDYFFKTQTIDKFKCKTVFK